MKSLVIAATAFLLGGAVAYSVPIRRVGGQMPPQDVLQRSRADLEPVAAGDTVESVVRAWFAYRIALAKTTGFSRSLGRVTLETYGSQLLDSLEVIPTFQVVDSTAVLTRFKVGDQTIKEAQWLRLVDGKWVIVGNPVYMMTDAVRHADNPVTRPYVAEKKKVDELFAKVDSWLQDAQPLWE